MANKLWFTATSLTVLILCLVTLQLARTTFAGAPEPRPPGSTIKGPDIHGDLIAMFSEDAGGTISSVVAECKGHEFVVGPFFFPGTQTDFTTGTTKESLESGWKVDGVGPAGCLSKLGGETLSIEKVKSFDVQTDTLVIVDIKIIGIN
jgi:hypothetical protein